MHQGELNSSTQKRGQETKARNKFNWIKTVPPKGFIIWQLRKRVKKLKQTIKGTQKKLAHKRNS